MSTVTHTTTTRRIARAERTRVGCPASGRTGQLKDPAAGPTHDVIIPA